MKITRSISSAPLGDQTWTERWEGSDRGLIACWERGREKAREDPALAARARAGELVILPWKGGVERAIKQGQKVGTLYYLAMWQGLRGDSLDISLTDEPSLVCTKTGMKVTYTLDETKYANSEPGAAEA
jgi:hypothetical protein